MEELKYILDQHRIGWKSPMIFITKKEVVTLSPELIFHKVFDLRVGDRNALVNKLRLHQDNRRNLLNYLERLGKCIVNTKL